MASAENWCMNVSGRIFGPYTTAQMASFVEERRLAYHSLVAPAGSRDFRPALQFSELRPLFKSKAAPAESVVRAGPPPGDALLAIFGSEQGVDRAGRVFANLRYVMPLSATTYLIRSEKSAEALRDELAMALPNTERAIVLPCGASPAACHGISLDEHERISDLIVASESRSFR